MDYKKNTDQDCWESGIRFIEKRRPGRVLRFLALLMVVFFSGSIGGIIGGYYVKKNYSPNSELKNNQSTKDNTQTVIKSSTSITKVADEVGPAVVGVTKYIGGSIGNLWGGNTIGGTGSGIIIDSKGYIVTNYHVVENAAKISVTLPGGKKVEATYVGGDEAVDLAVLKVKDINNLPVARFGDSSKVRVGDTAIAIGNPLGEELAGSVTAGIISALNREITIEGEANKYLQTDASINPGNSGGALCNDQGEVIGINTIKAGSAEGIGFAIPSNTAKPIIDELISKGKVSRPYLGIGYVFIDKYYAENWKVPMGIGIKTIVKDSPAEKAGLKVQDIIVGINGVEMDNENSLKSILKNYKIGDEVTLRVWRDGNYGETKIKLGNSGDY